jgi:hypothetical protein
MVDGGEFYDEREADWGDWDKRDEDRLLERGRQSD